MSNRLEATVSELGAQVNEAEVNKCCHHWLIEKPNGPISRGMCKYCREEREFSNSPPQYSNRNGMRRSPMPSNRRFFNHYQVQM